MSAAAVASEPRLNVETPMIVEPWVFFTFAGRAYGVGPLPVDEGREILEALNDAKSAGTLSDRPAIDAYHDGLRRLRRTLWRNTRPVGRIRRLRKRFGLLRKEYRPATDAQLVKIAEFMLAQRFNITGLTFPERGED